LDENGNSPLGQVNQDCKYYEPYQLFQMIEGSKIALSSFHLNRRSLSSNWDAFYNILCDLHNKEFSFDIITRCRNDDGIGLYIKDSINFKVREDLSIFIPHVYESLFVEVENESHKKIIAGVIYRLNGNLLKPT